MNMDSLSPIYRGFLMAPMDMTNENLGCGDKERIKKSNQEFVVAEGER